ncbi:MAG: hypothetical protein BWZ03_00236 [bacterium ADurb.BinA186]|nr:MAG: hypothetical protein BWZ03_00236 [bacterium ADurb.BinA186]
MAQLDANIFLQQKGPDFDQISEGFDRGIRLGDMMKQRKIQDLEIQKQNKIKDAYQSGVVINPDGSQSFNAEMTLGNLMKVDPKEAFNFKAQQAANLKSDLEGQYAKNSFVSSLLETVKDQDSYLAAKSLAISKGIKEAEQLPNTYDPQVIGSLKAQYQKASLTPSQQMEDSRKREEAQARLAELQDRRLERKDLINLRNEEKQMALTTPYGLANTPDDAKIIKEAHEAKMSLFSQVDEMIKLRQKYGGGAIMEPDDQGYATQLSNDALLAYKNLKKLGVLSKSDEDIVNAIIPKDPLRLRGAAEVISGQDAVLSKLVNFRDNKSKDFASGIQARIRGGDAAAKKVLEEDQKNAPKAKDDQSTQSVDQKIQNFMQKNGIQDKNEAIRILKENGRL